MKALTFLFLIFSSSSLVWADFDECGLEGAEKSAAAFIDNVPQSKYDSSHINNQIRNLKYSLEINLRTACAEEDLSFATCSEETQRLARNDFDYNTTEVMYNIRVKVSGYCVEYE
jgi:hypothetical protein